MVLGQGQLVNSGMTIVGPVNACAATGAVNTYACALDPAITTYTTRGCYSFAANAANTGAATLNLNTLGAKTIKKVQSGITTDLVADDIRTGQLVHVCYDGTNMQLMSPLGNASTGAPGGAAGTVQYNAGALGGTTGLTVDGTNLLSLQARTTPMNANDTIDPADGPIIACTAGATNKTATLPSAATTTQGWIRLLKVDSGVGACLLAPGGSDTLNGAAATKAATTQWSYVEVWRRSTIDWHAQTGVTSISLTTDVNGILPTANGGTGWGETTVAHSLYIPAGSMDVTGGCLQNDPAVLVANGPKLPTITCTDNNADSIEFNWVSPDAWNAGTVTVQLHAFNALAVSTALAMHFAGVCVSSNDTIPAHVTTGEQLATVTWTSAINKEVSGTTSPITLQGPCTAGDHVYMRGQIDGTGANTVLDMTAVKILGVKVRYSNVRALEFAP